MSYFHTTPVDLAGQTLLLPPSRTGREPSWEGMDPAELDLVFMSGSLEEAWSWAEWLYDPGTGQPYIYEVEPQGDHEVGAHAVTAPSARIVRRVHPPCETSRALRHTDGACRC